MSGNEVKSSPPKKSLVPLNITLVCFSYENCDLLRAQLQPLPHHCSAPRKISASRDFLLNFDRVAAWNSAQHCYQR